MDLIFLQSHLQQKSVWHWFDALELQAQFESQAKAQADAEIETQRKNAEEQAVSSAMKHLLTNDARARIARISLATPERADSIKKLIIRLHDDRKFTPPMTDDMLKTVLASNSKSRSNASIRRIWEGARNVKE